ncbi:MAG: 50S ribosomal protein L2 [Candidatus Sungbacteria bacterium]|uniref:Large ribosomal subunit protein uL2 n=1 Tax=Candidatus Sungiibacteriota bacterium TaxID=2750080 RepID=A0A933DU26_9BACT|nr:50S ribosomal protein L2 [Candidatus Sungbacteria bacterium]
MKKYSPTSAGRRHGEMVDTAVLTRKEPEKSLSTGFHRAVGRNAFGRITVRHKGGGAKRLFRHIDFQYGKKDIPAVVEAIEYDPNRTSWIALVRYADGEKRYVLAPREFRPGSQFVVSGVAPIAVGNRLPLKAIPVGTSVFNIEFQPGRGAQLVRSAGSAAEILAVEGKYVQLKLPSGEIRQVSAESWATIGSLSNPERSLETVGKAGRARHRGIRPTVRGTAMNPRDHPHGGGEGRAPRGTRRPKTMWGKVTGGVKTRKKKWSDRLILQRRK